MEATVNSNLSFLVAEIFVFLNYSKIVLLRQENIRIMLAVLLLEKGQKLCSIPQIMPKIMLAQSARAYNWPKNSSPSLLMWSNVIRDNFFACNCTIFSWMKNFLILGIIFFLLFNHPTPPSKGEKRSDFCPSRPSLFEEDIERLGQIYMKFLRWRLFQNNGVFQQEFFLFWLFYRHLPTSMAGILLILNYLTLWKKSKIIFMVF